MSKTTETAADNICLADETLHDIVATLGQALKPQIYYHPDHHQLTEDALKASQNHVQTALKKLLDALPPAHWLVQEVADVIVAGEAVWNRYPF